MFVENGYKLLHYYKLGLRTVKPKKEIIVMQKTIK